MIEKMGKKICFAASAGGHLEQLLMLRPLMDRYDSFIITEKTDYRTFEGEQKVYYVPQVNRKRFTFVLKLFIDFVKSFVIFIIEKPDIVISTGVLATIPMCIIAKIFHKKLIYIESFAKLTSPTKTGKFLYRFSDQFYVQWESMLEYYPDAIYVGGIY